MAPTSGGESQSPARVFSSTSLNPITFAGSTAVEVFRF
jgi:hypothetical protein